MLIDSILRGWSLPKLYFLKISDDPAEYEVVDGQQRLSAIFGFLDEEFELDDDQEMNFGGRSYAALPDALQDRFDDFKLQFDEIEDSTEEEVREYFGRLQQGLPLTTSEKLNAKVSKLRDWCKEKSKHQFFKKKVRISDRRYAYFDIIVKAAAIEIEQFDINLRLGELSDLFEQQANFSPNSASAKRLNSTLKFLNEALPNNASYLKSRAIVQTVINLAAYLVRNSAADEFQNDFSDFLETFFALLRKEVEAGVNATDSDLLTFQKTTNANQKTSAELRHKIMLRKLLALKPAIAKKLAGGGLKEVGFEAMTKKKAEEIQTLIKTINQNATAIGEKEVFKLTTKTTDALLALANKVSDLADYDEFLDHIYFLFWGGTKPDSGVRDLQAIKDANLLRNAHSHDFDHGKSSDVAKKLKKAGDTFEKYSGHSNPQAIDPTVFELFQTAILSEIAKELAALKNVSK